MDPSSVAHTVPQGQPSASVATRANSGVTYGSAPATRSRYDGHYTPRVGDLGRFWTYFDKATEDYNEDIINALKADLSSLLVFAALFSRIRDRVKSTLVGRGTVWEAKITASHQLRFLVQLESLRSGTVSNVNVATTHQLRCFRSSAYKSAAGPTSINESDFLKRPKSIVFKGRLVASFSAFAMFAMHVSLPLDGETTTRAFTLKRGGYLAYQHIETA